MGHSPITVTVLNRDSLLGLYTLTPISHGGNGGIAETIMGLGLWSLGLMYRFRVWG